MITIDLNPEIEAHLRNMASNAKTSADEMVRRIVIEYMESHNRSEGLDRGEIPPITRSLMGIMKHQKIGEEDYRKYLEEKYR